MRIFTVIFTILIFVNCGSKEIETDNQGWTVQGESQQVPPEEEEQEEEESANFIFLPAKLEPVNESKKDEDLEKVLNDLLEAIKNKDVEGVKAHIDTNIKIGFGEEYGVNDFVEMWNLASEPEKSLVWQELQNAITLGGTFDEDNPNAYYTPYTFTNFPERYDPFEYAVITGRKVNIRSEPSTKGKVVAQLSYDIVKVLQFDKDLSKQSQTIGSQTHNWQKIQMAEGEVGYVWGKFCRTGIDYRAGFAKIRDEGWKMTFFLAGD